MNQLLNYFGSKIQQPKLIQMEDIFQGELEIFDMLLWPLFFQSQFQVESVNDLVDWLELILGTSLRFFPFLFLHFFCLFLNLP